MATLITMPKLSDTMEEGAIASWFKKEGDFVEEGELLAEIETDKATMEYESPEEGVLYKIVIPEGDKGDVGAALAIFADKGEKPDVEALLAGGSKKTSSAPVQEKETKSAQDKSSSGPEPKAATTEVGAQGRPKASPLARKVAQAKGVDLGSLQGSGPNGRIVLRDVESAEKMGGSAHVAASETQEARRGPSVVSRGEEDTIEKVSMMRKTIAKRLLSAKNDAPHFYLKRDVDMTQSIAWRERLNRDVEKNKDLPKVSFNDIVMLATAKALRKHPQVNASWEGETVRKFGHVSIAMAVALPTGLVTPVLANTDRMGVREIATLSKDFARRAKDGSLTNEDYVGGTFTISNLGMADIDEFTAIINPPQACILAVGSTKARAVVDETTGEIVARPIMRVTLSCDHRVVDGWVGAMFLKDLVAHLEDPMMMLS